MISAYDLVYETIGNEVWDQDGTCYRVEDIKSVKTTSGDYEYAFGLRECGSLTRKMLRYVSYEDYVVMAG